MWLVHGPPPIGPARNRAFESQSLSAQMMENSPQSGTTS